MIIDSKSKLNGIVDKETELYYHNSNRSFREKVELNFVCDIDYYYIQSFLKLLRKSEYLLCSSEGMYWLRRIKYFITKRKRNQIASRLGFSISENVLGENVILCHPNIVINPKSVVGANCIFHGNNCIGNKGFCENTDAPVVGNNVEIGYGAVIIGGIYIANGIKIGANAVVTKSFYEPNIVIAGNPAVRICGGNKDACNKHNNPCI